MKLKEDIKKQNIRWKKLELLQQEYRSFNYFLTDVMGFLGFGDISIIQEDIAEFLQFGPKKSMVQAQRGQAKTTITAAFAVWTLIHNPKARIVIVSSTEETATQISSLIVRIILGMPELECMKPDKTAGDRVSVSSFDIHYSLKGVDKSPSIACSGVSGSMTGWRADLLIADDVEHQKNSMTAKMREQLIERTKEFGAICENGKILYLGTPQSNESIYNSLPQRGYTIRVWPGRYPTPEQLPRYGDNLAPMIIEHIELNPSLQSGGGVLKDQGKNTDPRINEQVLQEKEDEYGLSGFQLQYMLNTALSDKEKYPLKTVNIILMNFGEKAPLALMRNPSIESQNKHFIGSHQFNTSNAIIIDNNFEKLKSKIMYIDPAGGGANNDETGYCVAGFLNGNIYVSEIGGLPGGYNPSVLQKLADIAKANNVDMVKIEKNFGYGAFKEVFAPVLLQTHRCGIEDDMVSGQKEKRIINVLEPVLGRGSLIFHSNTIDQDIMCSSVHPIHERQSYSLFYQLNKVNYIKDSLKHDDRLDALAGAVHHFARTLQIPQTREMMERAERERKLFMSNPFGRKQNSVTRKQVDLNKMFNRPNPLKR